MQHSKYGITFNITMAPTKRIPVPERVWAEISELKHPGQTFDDLLRHLVEKEKKRLCGIPIRIRECPLDRKIQGTSGSLSVYANNKPQGATIKVIQQGYQVS